MRYAIILSAVAIMACFAPARAQTINVDAGTAVKVLGHNPAAVNLNYLTDDDAYLNPSIPLVQSLRNMKAGMLRFPGGEKADNYLWSSAPYNAANPAFATQGNCNWPNNDSRFSSNFINPLSSTMDFDEFMDVCDSTGANSLIVVAGDAHYNTWCTNPPTLSDLITNAMEWVKYANITNNYGIRHWMVGNESWNKAAYDNPSTAQQYAADFVQFAAAMKAVDPTITLIANSRPGTWVNALLQAAPDSLLDAIAISNYPVWAWTQGYDTYRNGNPSFTDEVTAIVTAIGSRDIKVIVSEYNAIDWNGDWPDDNDLGHALVNFQMLGDQLLIPEVENAYLWNTRWVNNDTDPQHLNDALDANGNLNATGKALAMWGNHALDKLVLSDNDGFIRSFATADSSGALLNIFLINKDLSAHTATVNISNYTNMLSPGLTITETKLTGSAATDKFPVISNPSGNAAVSGNQIALSLDPLSVHVIALRDSLSTGQTASNRFTRQVRIHPNPATDVLFVQPVAEQTRIRTVMIHNTLGKLLLIKEFGYASARLDISALPTGLYFIEVITAEGFTDRHTLVVE